MAEAKLPRDDRAQPWREEAAPTGAFRTAAWHLHQNLLMRNRLGDYRQLLRDIASRGYRFSTVEAFTLETKAGRDNGDRICIFRMDVDSDPAGAARMFEIAGAEGVRATYYFRLATLDPPLARRMQAQGSEVGYHFEEIATFAKRKGLSTTAQIEANIPAIRNEFRHNLLAFRQATGVRVRTVAAHGDFINRRLGIKNSRIVNRELMEECDLVGEAQEPWLMHAVSDRITDRPEPQGWRPHSPGEALAASPRVLYILVHPRQWARAPLLNTALDMRRGLEEIGYRWRARRGNP